MSESAPERSSLPPPVDPRTADERAADHDAIERLASELLPALIAKLAAARLGELEVREGRWKVRLRRPVDGSGSARRTSDGAARAQPGHAGHGHAPAAFEGHRSARPAGGAGHSTNGSSPPSLAPVGPGLDRGRGSRPDPHRAVVTSPAVGIFRPRTDLAAGSRVRAGDRVGSIDMLGVPHEVIAPADGIVGASLAETGQAVEYGQDLVLIELALPAGDERAEG